MPTLVSDKILQHYAELTVKLGLNLQPGQRLFILAYQLEVAPLVRQVTRSAYQHGCNLVSVLWLDEQCNKLRYQHAPRDSFEEYAAWMTNGCLQSIERGDAYLQISGPDPVLLRDQDPELVAKAYRIAARHYKPIGDHQGINTVQWLVICPPTPGWAARVYPQETPEKALVKLWDEVAKACRLEEHDPITFWQQHVAELDKRKAALTEKQYTKLQFSGPGTELTVVLPNNHIWGGGSSKTSTGIPFVVNLPTEEVFTTPHKDKINGTVTATRPLNYRGNLIEDFSLTFSEGKVVNFTAEKGAETLRKLLDTDEGASLLGEVALVPHHSPIAQSGLIFMNSLYDENASSHLALGSAYRTTLKDGEKMTDEEFAHAGGNDSVVHVDFMFGSGEMNVDGLKADGSTEPVMRAGEWAFDV